MTEEKKEKILKGELVILEVKNDKGIEEETLVVDIFEEYSECYVDSVRASLKENELW